MLEKQMTISMKSKKANKIIDSNIRYQQITPVKHKFTILLVDDEERILNFLKTKLKTLGYDVVLANNGMEALEQLREQQPDMVVLDVIMPKMDGFQTIKELRSFSAVPVIMLSARGDDSDRFKGLGLGADDYLPKPIARAALIAKIHQHLLNTVPV